MEHWKRLNLLVLLMWGCGSEPDHQVADWQSVLARKSAVTRAPSSQDIEARQAYVDALRDFRRRYPDHARAREVYRQTELEFARQLFSAGNYAEAAVFYESLLRDDPLNAGVKKEWSEAMRRCFITREALAELRKGMRPAEVAELLGRPLPGWEKTMRKGTGTILSWYYPRSDGGVGGVYFLDGRLFAAEYERAVKLRP